MSATDGIFDNLFNHEILRIVREFKNKFPRLVKKEQADVSWFINVFQILAEMIVREANEKVKDKKKKTPYQRKYKKTYNATWEVR